MYSSYYRDDWSQWVKRTEYIKLHYFGSSPETSKLNIMMYGWLQLSMQQAGNIWCRSILYWVMYNWGSNWNLLISIIKIYCTRNLLYVCPFVCGTDFYLNFKKKIPSAKDATTFKWNSFIFNQHVQNNITT